MATNKKLDAALADTVERVLEDLMTRFDAAEKQLENREDLPELSPETEATLLREIEADLDLHYPRPKEEAAVRSSPASEAVGQMIAWLRVSGTETLDRIAELVLPSMPTGAVARSKSTVLDELNTEDGVNVAALRELQFVPIRLERDGANTNILTLRYFGEEPVPTQTPALSLFVDGNDTPFDVDSNLPFSPPEVEVVWLGEECNLTRIGKVNDGNILINIRSA